MVAVNDSINMSAGLSGFVPQSFLSSYILKDDKGLGCTKMKA